MTSGEPEKVEQPPILDEEDDKILNKIWDERGKEEQASKGDKSRFTDDIIVEIQKTVDPSETMIAEDHWERLK